MKKFTKKIRHYMKNNVYYIQQRLFQPPLLIKDPCGPER